MMPAAGRARPGATPCERRPHCCAQVFRTYNASITLCSELAKTGQMVTDEQRLREGDLVALNNYYAIANKVRRLPTRLLRRLLAPAPRTI